MIKVTFKSLEPSELAKEVVRDRLEYICQKFEHLKDSSIRVTLEMENSPTQAGPDLFRVKVQVSGGPYDGVRISKSAPSLYSALADVADHMLEVLNRFSDKVRVRNRSKSRTFSKRTAMAL